MAKTKDDIKSYQILLDSKDKEIELLKHKLDNIDRLYNVRCCECERGAIQDLSDMHIKIMPFEDEYFKDLDFKAIAELAKKSIRITAQNSDLEYKLEQLIKEAEFKLEALPQGYFISYFEEEFLKKVKEVIETGEKGDVI